MIAAASMSRLVFLRLRQRIRKSAQVFTRLRVGLVLVQFQNARVEVVILLERFFEALNQQPPKPIKGSVRWTGRAPNYRFPAKSWLAEN